MSTTLHQIRNGLRDILVSEPKALLMGEDLLDPYGGAFKVTKGLSSDFPNQILQTPISEGAFCGAAAGLAYRGHLPIVEIMFGDFLPIVCDAVVNTASKLRWLGRERMKGRLMIRTPVGGRRGYGPIHSQSLEKLFFGFPEITVVSPHFMTDSRALVIQTFIEPSAVKLFVEYKLDYGAIAFSESELSRMGFSCSDDAEEFPTTFLTNTDAGSPPDIIMCCYGGMVRHCIEAAYELFLKTERTSMIIAPTRIFPLDIRPLTKHLGPDTRMLIAEEGYSQAGWSATLLRALSGECGLSLNRITAVGSKFTPIPCGLDAEQEHFPSGKSIAIEAQALLAR